MPLCWDLWQDGAHTPSWNMATDEALLDTALLRGRPMLRFYGWNCPAVSIGCFQACSAVPRGFSFVRRPTGGGVVYHDHDFTYTVVLPQNHPLAGLNRTESYDAFNQVIQVALQQLNLPATLAQCQISPEVDRRTMVCFANPTRYDVLVSGEKIAGSAQRRTDKGILHQGSLHFGGPLPFSREAIATHIRNAWEKHQGVCFASFLPDGALLSLIREKDVGKYATDTWNRRK